MSRRLASAVLAVLAMTVAMGSMRLLGQADPASSLVRRAKSKFEPTYPELARKMKIAGTVKIEVVVNPAGVVKEARVVGGHPVLAGAALEAAKKWRFEPAPFESSGVIDFKFEPR